ncbi:NAD-dependent epimerase/dehydratase family protein [Actinoalloteichus hymeniacidonis]|uniref:Nucleoside-diphosphate-sugar epimerase n=1 Tax=Actinoalloteichus hymeniacidonis TaxID=340345 RepID=A0AAC9HUE5_9PSEU|nr:SDR family oxidoreductase [Actinoalloteichus hymeniacidonis]AOS65907.1 nucleoside-diphosphate-sugar epimerase [Actinoalloteichus hymeniacidonis]MBB5905997.1 nucleoside-diphosphate-sugar epimerase [Actinoalloteichus hymeniacidonis]
MRVLVTGHLGYLGGVLVPVLMGAGHEIVGMDSGLFADCLLGPAVADPGGYRIDIRDATEEHFRGVDAVVHLAALSNDPLGHLAPEMTYEINHHASVRLAALAKAAGVRRFLYASTCSVYGAAGDELVNEEAALRPVTPYAESKVRVEDDLRELADDHFSPVFLRNATAFGASPRQRVDIVLNNLVGYAMLTGQVRVLSDGTPWRPLVHVRDIAAAFLAALQAPRHAVHSAAFNVGLATNNLTVAQIAEAVVATIPGSSLLITGENGADPRSYRVDFSRIRDRIPAFAPRWSVGDGAEELHATYSAYGLTSADFHERFTRLAWLTGLRDRGRLAEDLRPAKLASVR